MEAGLFKFDEEDFLACCGSPRFATEMAKASPFSSLQQAVAVARDVWFDKVDVTGWLQAFAAHPQIGHSASSSSHPTSAQWSKGEQSTAIATATSSSLQELAEWNGRYREKFGFVFLICASGKSTDGILAELKKRYPNRPIVEFEIAAKEQMKITELRLAKLFSTQENVPSTGNVNLSVSARKAEEDRASIIGGHLCASSEIAAVKNKIPTRTRPPITTHVLDVSQGSPAAGIEVCLEMWKGHQPRPVFGESAIDGWVLQGSSTTNSDGRSGQLLSIVDAVNPGIYRISFNTGKYCPGLLIRKQGKMQAIKDKINDVMHVNEEARAEEKAEKELAKARADVAHEVRLAKEAEATMSYHIAKAGEIARAGDQKANEHLETAAAAAEKAQPFPSNSNSMSPPTYNKMS